MKNDILGYENVTILKEFEQKAGHKILLYKDESPSLPYGILFEEPYKGTGSYKRERGGCFNYRTINEAIDAFTDRINHYLKHTVGHSCQN
jgi:hypothetical protein